MRKLCVVLFVLLLIASWTAWHYYKEAKSNIYSICIYYHKDNPYFQEKGSEKNESFMQILH